MKQKNKDHILFRYLLINGFILIFVLDIIYKMIGTTVIKAELWNRKAENTLSSVARIEPERGKILADDGSVLAANLHFYTARIDWSAEGIKEKTFKKNLPALCDSLEAFTGGKTTAKQWKKQFEKCFYAEKKNKAYRLFSGLSHSEYLRLKDFPYFNLAKNKNGLYYETTMKRCKPYGAMASRSIGQVGELPSKIGQHGVSGLEKALDSLLYGVPGKASKVQLTSNIVNWENIPAKRGYDIMTTININLQDIVEEELYNMCVESNARWGTAVLMEVNTGEIKAISNLEWNDSFSDYVEGRNNAVLGYEPGSVMKPISMMIALEDGIVSNIDSIMTTGGSFAYAGGRAITDTHPMASMPVRRVIEASSNVGMARIILRGYEKDPGLFYDRLKGMGFFDPLHTGIAGEEIPDIRRLGTNNWDRIALSRMAFGYTTRIPPMCTLAMYNAIANDGKYVRPRLVKQLMHGEDIDSVYSVSYIRRQVCSALNASKLRTMLHDVVWGQYGTGKVLQDDNVEIAGKTGTCYTIENGQYGSQKRLAFCGFFPYKHPKYTCIVLMLGANRGAARSSGMVLKNIALRLYARGLLDNTSDYRAGNSGVEKDATLYASYNGGRNQAITSELDISHTKQFHAPAPVSSRRVPSVIGLSVREAIARLENIGLTVRFAGAGYVVGQNIPAGSQFRKGQIINLTLRH